MTSSLQYIYISGAPDFITIIITRAAIRFRAKKPSPQATRNFALVCLWCRRTVGRSVYDQVIKKVTRMGSLLHFLNHGAPLPRARRESSAMISHACVEA